MMEEEESLLRYSMALTLGDSEFLLWKWLVCRLCFLSGTRSPKGALVPGASRLSHDFQQGNVSLRVCVGGGTQAAFLSFYPAYHL